MMVTQLLPVSRIHSVNALFFLIVMYRCEIWTIKKKNLNTEELMPLNCGIGEDSWESQGCRETKPVNPKGNQHWIFIGRTDAETEAPILWPHGLLEKPLMPGNIEVRKRRRWQRTRWLDVNTASVDMTLSKLWKMMKGRETWCAVVHWVTESDMTERLNDNKNSAFQHKLFSTQAQRVLDLMNHGRLNSYFFSGVNKSYS